MTENLALAADLVFTPQVVVATYEELAAWPPFRWKWWPAGLRWTRYRSVRRGFVLRARTLRELISDQMAFEAMQPRYADDAVGLLMARCMVVTGSPAVVYVPAKVLRIIDATYRSVNELPELVDETEAQEGTAVTFDSVLRRLEREPFRYTRDEILAMTTAQIAARLKEWGEEKQHDEERQAELIAVAQVR